jgi:hypothetical protein
MTIKLSGKIAISDIRSELAPTASTRLSASDFRALVAPKSGLRLSDYYGASNIPPQQDYDFNVPGRYDFALPANIRYISVAMVGGAGGGGGRDVSGGSGYPGGEGRYHQVVIDTQALGAINRTRNCAIYVGAGAKPRSGGFGYHYGGDGGNGPRSGAGGGGGGASAIEIDGFLIAYAGGGGGGGGGGYAGLYYGGAGVYYEGYYGGNSVNQGTVSSLSGIGNGYPGGPNYSDGGGAGGGGGGHGVGYDAWIGNAGVGYSRDYFMLLPSSQPGYGFDNDWGSNDVNGPGGGAGANYYMPNVVIASNSGRFSSPYGKPGGFNSSFGGDGQVYIRTLATGYLNANIGEIYPIRTPLTPLLPLSMYVPPPPPPPPDTAGTG